jgi:Ribonuclease toxin, BrnT, of type II toxin-antitoxin system
MFAMRKLSCTKRSIRIKVSLNVGLFISSGDVAAHIKVCMDLEWNDDKNAENTTKHGLSFYEAQDAFFDKGRVILRDTKHSSYEKRYFCIGKTANGGIACVSLL